MNSSEAASPYLSIVVTGRNDDYGGDFNLRLGNFVKWLSVMIEQHEIPTELVLVNYNPLLDKAPLTDTIPWPADRKFLQFRIITIPEEVHVRFHDPEVRKKVPLYEFISKNMGIRRAKGEFILCTNADILFDPDIFEFIRPQTLKKTSFYRTDRADFRPLAPEVYANATAQPGAFLKAVQDAVYQLFMQGYSFDYEQGSTGFYQNLMAFRAKARKKRPFTLFRSWMLNTIPFPGWKGRMGISEFKWHCNASGDCMLMHRDHWMKLRGYPENTWISTHVDSTFVVMAAMLGLKQELLPAPVYHQDHERRYGWDSIRNDEVFREVFEKFQRQANQMVKEKRPLIENPENWGLPEETFEESVF